MNIDQFNKVAEKLKNLHGKDRVMFEFGRYPDSPDLINVVLLNEGMQRWRITSYSLRDLEAVLENIK